MKLKFVIPLLLVLFGGVYFLLYKKDVDPSVFPKPSTGETIVKEGGDDEDSQSKREAWFELMHQVAPGTDWKNLEYQTSMKRHIMRSDARRIASSRGDDEILANGNLTGEWFERGSIDQAGSVFVTEYDPQTNDIYLISAGGTLFKGTLAGNDWEVINQDVRFENNFLNLIDMGSEQRLVANIADRPHYSDDGGYTWTLSSGVQYENTGNQTKDPIVLKNVDNHIYILSKRSNTEPFKLYKSIDNGTSYQEIHNLGSSTANRFTMVNPHNTDEIYLLERINNSSTKLYQVDQANNTLNLLNENNDFGFQLARTNLKAVQVDTITRFISYTRPSDMLISIYQSEDFGANWTHTGDAPTYPWNVGLYVSPSNPDFLMYGDIECYASPDGGATWNKTNNWWDYYSDVEGSLHADMMYFNEFETAQGEPFLLISNHGGLSVTYDLFDTKENLGMTNLNVSQYYDVVTDPIDPVFIYAGSQDQGFQRALVFDNESIAEFDQVISGDYGHIVFSEGGERMWTVYPFGWVTLYNFPQDGQISASWSLKLGHQDIWIPPLMPSPDESENAIYLAGGNLYEDEGSYLIKLEYNDTNDAIDTSQIDYDFTSFSGGGEISMMRTSTFNSDHWYVSTSNGRFFYSYDGGSTWDQSLQFIPSGHYLYGSAIYPSNIDSSTVYFAGSGYSNPAVYKSTDGGQNFTAMNNGMPQTLVFELAANEDETMFFAATEAGPYVYIVAEEQWYDMSGMAAPNQTYWSVEYINDLDIVRFGTYGRGIWDFQVKEIVNTSEPLTKDDQLTLFPNPTSDQLNISLEKSQSNSVSLTLTSISGKQVWSQAFETIAGQSFNQNISLAKYPKGAYILTLSDGTQLLSKQVVLQ